MALNHSSDPVENSAKNRPQLLFDIITFLLAVCPNIKARVEMHPNPIFREQPTERNIAFVQERGFGVLTINGTEEPLTSSIPAMLSNDGATLEFHLLRSNPIAKALSRPTKAVFLVNGPDSYISPDWYGANDQVPTWNYVAVRITGEAQSLDHGDLKEILDRLSTYFEKRLTPKHPWISDKMSPGVMEKMMRSIVPCKIAVENIEGTWKLNQNKPSEVRGRAADEVEKSGIGLSPVLLAKLMRAVDE